VNTRGVKSAHFTFGEDHAYCRFLEGDVYMYEHVDGFIECCMCSLAPKVNSISTIGITKEDTLYNLFGELKPCKKCSGKGCDDCMVPGNTELHSYEEAIEHLKKHEAAGDKVPARAYSMLKEEIESNQKLGE